MATAELEEDYGVTLCLSIYCTPDPHVDIIDGPTVVVPAPAVCSWTASASGGVPPFSYAWSGVASGSGNGLEAEIYNSGMLYVTVTDDVGHDDTDGWYIQVDEELEEAEGCDW